MTYRENEEMARDRKSYDVYDRGYKSGTQTNIFLGPIWLEEVIAVTKQTTSGDAPLYGYSDIYHNSLMVGQYLVTGTIAIAFTEPNYLNKIISQIKNMSIQDEELYAMMHRRKSIFQNSVKYKLLTEKVLNNMYPDSSPDFDVYARNYTEKIMTEIELSGLNTSTRCDTFELTIVRGNLYDSGASIDIYEDVKITGTVDNIVNDDSASVEMYTFIAKKKPHIKNIIDIKRPNGKLSKQQVLDMMTEVAKKLIRRVLEGPDVSITFPRTRVSLMSDANQVGYTGIMSDRVRLYGNKLSTIEIVWEYAFDRFISSVSKHPRVSVENGEIEYDTTIDKMSRNVPENNRIMSDTTLVEHFIEDNVVVREVDTGLVLHPPEIPKGMTRDSETNGFDNSYGIISAVDKEQTSRLCAAIARVVPIPHKTRRLGGSIILPRYNIKELYAGMMQVPQLVDAEMFSFNEQDIPNITAATLWWQPFGIRESSKPMSPTNNWNTYGDPDMANDAPSSKINNDPSYKDEGHLNSITNPLFSVGVFDDRSFTIEEDKVTIHTPFLVDTYLTPSDNIGNKETPYTTSRPSIQFTFINDIFTPEFVAPVTSSTRHKFNGIERVADSSIFDIKIPNPNGIPATLILNEYTGVEGFEGLFDENTWEVNRYRPYPIEFTLSTLGNKLISGLNKCIHVRPWLYFYNIPVIIEDDPILGWTVTKSPDNDEYNSLPNNIKKWNYLDSKFGEKSCDYSGIYYDWRITNDNTKDIVSGSFEISGLYFVELSKSDPVYLTIFDGTEVIQCEIKEDILIYKDQAIPVQDLHDHEGEYINIYDIAKLQTFWTCTVVPIGVPDDIETRELYKSDGSSDPPVSDNSIELTYTLEDRSARLVQIYNIIRCNILRFPRKSWEDEEGESKFTATELKILKRIDRWLTGIFVNNLSLDYRPYEESLERISAFSRGYVFRIYPAQIVDQLFNCVFSKSTTPQGDRETSTQEIEGKTVSDILNQLLGITSTDGDQDGLISGEPSNKAVTNSVVNRSESVTVKRELYTIVRNIITTEINSRALRIVEEDENSILIFIETDIPVPNVIRYSLTKEGYDDMIDINNYIDTEDPSSPTPIFGGYDE